MSSNNVTELPTIKVKKRNKIYREYDKYSDEALNNIRKNMDADMKSTNKYFSNQLPVDEIATMGSDTQGIVRDHRNIPPEMKSKWDSMIDDSSMKKQLAETHLKERGYEAYYTKRTAKNPDPKLAFKHPLLKKTLRVMAPIAAIGGALMAPDAAQAAVDFVVPGGVESMGVSPEQAELDKAYKARIRQRQESLNSLPH